MARQDKDDIGVVAAVTDQIFIGCVTGKWRKQQQRPKARRLVSCWVVAGHALRRDTAKALICFLGFAELLLDARTEQQRLSIVWLNPQCGACASESPVAA